MLIVGADYHPGFQQIAFVDMETGELQERLIIGNPERFHCSNQVASYVGLVPTEESSGERRRLGHISKQGSTPLHFFLVEAALVTVRSDPEWRGKVFPHERSPRWRWPGGWWFVCAGCNASNGITSSGKLSFRRCASPDQALVCSKTPGNRLGSPLPFYWGSSN